MDVLKINDDDDDDALKFGECAFAVAAPKAWNSLPDSLKQTNDTVKFRKDLKTYLFNLAYN